MIRDCCDGLGNQALRETINVSDAEALHIPRPISCAGAESQLQRFPEGIQPIVQHVLEVELQVGHVRKD